MINSDHLNEATKRMERVMEVPDTDRHDLHSKSAEARGQLKSYNLYVYE